MKHTLIALLIGSAGVAHAATHDPLDADAPTLPLPTHAPLAGYQPFDESTEDWQTAHRAVQEAGGWRAYLRESHAESHAESQGNAPDAKAGEHSHHHR